MLSTYIYQGVIALLTVVAVCLSLATFIRSGRWRDSEEAKQIAKDIAAVAASGAAYAKSTDDALEAQNARIGVLEERTRDVATSSDISALRRELEAMEKLMGAKVDGVKEIVGGIRGDLTAIKQWTMREPG